MGHSSCPFRAHRRGGALGRIPDVRCVGTHAGTYRDRYSRPLTPPPRILVLLCLMPRSTLDAPRCLPHSGPWAACGLLESSASDSAPSDPAGSGQKNLALSLPLKSSIV